MKKLIQTSVALVVVSVTGLLLAWSIELRHTQILAADQPSEPAVTVRPTQPSRAQPEEQILLHAIVLEIDPGKLAALGVDLPHLPVPAGADDPSPGVSKTYSLVNWRAARRFVTKLAADGLGKVLAEPTMVTMAGREAKFHSGGELPLIVPQGKNLVSVEFRPIGTSLKVKPIRLPNGHVQMEIQVQQSELIKEKTVEVKGVRVPGLKVDQFEATLDVAAGQAAMVRGSGRLALIVSPEVVVPQKSPEPNDVVRPPDVQVGPTPYRTGLRITMVPAATTTVKFDNRIRKVLVEHGGVISVTTLDPYQVQITSKKAGTTTLSVWGEEDELQVLPIQVADPVAAAPLRPAPLATTAARAPRGAHIAVTVYTLDVKQAGDAVVNLRKALRENAVPVAQPAGTGRPRDSANSVSVLSAREVAALQQQLAQAKGVDVLSRPQLRTLSGQPCQVQIGSIVQQPAASGVQQASAQSHQVGLTLDLVPILTSDRIHLQARAERSRLGTQRVDSKTLFGVESQTLFGKAELYPGETLVICQDDEEDEQLLVLATPVQLGELSDAKSWAPRPQLRDTQQRDIQQKIDDAAARLEALKRSLGPQHPSFLQQQEQLATLRRADAQQQAVHNEQQQSSLDDLRRVIQEVFPDAQIRLHPLPNGVLLSGTVTDAKHSNVLTMIAESFYPKVIVQLNVATRPPSQRFPRKEQAPGADVEYTIEAPPQFDPALAVPAAPARRVPVRAPASLQRELRELRQDVKTLRGDVKRLIELLEGRPQPEGVGARDLPARPTQASADTPASPANWDLSLEAVVKLALQNSTFARNLGGVRVTGEEHGVDLAVTNSDVDVQQLEASVRQLVGDVEAAYWKLWAADRHIETYRAARNQARELWNVLSELKAREPNRAEAVTLEAASRQHYFAARSQLEKVDQERTRREQELRNVIGLAAVDDRLIHPTDRPTTSPLKLDHQKSLAHALNNAPQLRQQRSAIKSLERQLAAARKLTETPTAPVENLGYGFLPGLGQRQKQAQVRNLEVQLVRAKAQAEEMESSLARWHDTTTRKAMSAYDKVQQHVAELEAADQEFEQQKASFTAALNNDSIDLRWLDEFFESLRQAAYQAQLRNDALASFTIAAAQMRWLQGSLLDHGFKIFAASSSPDDEAALLRVPDPTTALKPRHRLRIESQNATELNRTVSILADGTLTLPLLGQVDAAGLSLERLRDQLESLYKQYYRNPDLTLSFAGTSVPLAATDALADDAAVAPHPAADLQPGDRLLLESRTGILRNRQLTVLADGSVTLPLLGQVPASGRTLVEFTAQLNERYGEFFQEPQCTVSYLGTSLPSR